MSQGRPPRDRVGQEEVLLRRVRLPVPPTLPAQEAQGPIESTDHKTPDERFLLFGFTVQNNIFNVLGPPPPSERHRPARPALHLRPMPQILHVSRSESLPALSVYGNGT